MKFDCYPTDLSFGISFQLFHRSKSIHQQQLFKVEEILSRDAQSVYHQIEIWPILFEIIWISPVLSFSDEISFTHCYFNLKEKLLKIIHNFYIKDRRKREVK